jgi:hypothetical protein
MYTVTSSSNYPPQALADINILIVKASAAETIEFSVRAYNLDKSRIFKATSTKEERVPKEHDSRSLTMTPR